MVYWTCRLINDIAGVIPAGAEPPVPPGGPMQALFVVLPHRASFHHLGKKSDLLTGIFKILLTSFRGVDSNLKNLNKNIGHIFP